MGVWVAQGTVLSVPICHVSGWSTGWNWARVFCARVLVAFPVTFPGMLEVLLLCRNLEGYYRLCPILAAQTG